MRKLTFYIINVSFVLFLAVNGNVFGKDFGKKTFISYSVENGLPSNSVYSIIQDSLGFLWFGTQQGFCRFDGLEFKVYKTDPYNENSLSFNNAGNLFYDSKGKIWIGTWGEGADCFDPVTETFTHYQNNPKDPTTIAGDRIQTIFEDSFGTLWFCSESHGLSRLDPENRNKGIFVNYTYDAADPNSISSRRVRNVAEDKNGNLWFSSDNGFFRLKKENRAKGIFERFSLPKIAYDLPSDIVYTVFISREGKLYLGTDYGLFIFDEPEKLTGKITRNNFKHVKFVRENYSLGFTTIFNIYQDHAGRIWLGTKNGGLILYGFGRGGFKRFLPSARKKNILWSTYIRALFEDSSQNLWIGTIDKGVARLDLKEHGFTSLSAIMPDKSFIVEDERGVVYFGASYGIEELKFENDKVKRTKINFPDYSLQLRSYTLGFYGDNHLYFYSKYSGFLSYNVITGEVSAPKNLNREINPRKNSLIFLLKSKIEPDYVWFIFQSGDVLRYNYKTDKVKDYLVISSKDYGKLVTAFEDDNGDIWFGTANGLGLWKRDETVLGFELPMEIKLFQHSKENRQSLINDYVTYIAKDNFGQYWIGTLDGISLMRFKDGKPYFRGFRDNNGLSNNHVRMIIPDGNKKIWFATDYGLSSLAISANRFINYYESDGLPGNVFLQDAGRLTKDGKMFFATRDGLVYFYPDSVTRNKIKPRPAISDIIFMNKKNKLPISISYAKKLVLSHDQNTFILKLASLEYTNPKSNKFYYKLEGYQKKWRKPDFKNHVTFIDLPQGEYLFKYSASNNNNVWGRVKTPLKIIIKPAFWQTNWFIIISIFIIIILIIVWHARKTKQIQKLQNEIIERKKTEEKLKESEKKYRELIDNALDAIFVISPEGIIQEVNPGFTELTGYTREETIGKVFFSGVFKEDVEKARQEFKKCLTKGSVRFETRIRKKTGEVEWISVLFNPVYDENRNLRYLHVIARNITELKKVEEELREAKKRAEHAEKLKSAFLAQMSHEIRTPVFTIVNSVEVFKYYDQYDEDVLQFTIEALEKASERIFRTMDLVLRMADLQTGFYKPHLNNENLVDTVKYVYSRYVSKAKQKGLEFTLSTFDDEINIEFDIDAVELILDNVINNAIKFTKLGRVDVRIVKRNGSVAVEVADTGKGISEKDKKIIFNPFIQVEQGYKRKFDGTGLGLTVSLEYCKYNNCELIIEKNHPKGTVVILQF